LQNRPRQNPQEIIMRRKTWSAIEAPDTLRVQAFREMRVGGGEGGGTGLAGGEGGFGITGGEGGGGGGISGGEGSGTGPQLRAAAHQAGGEGGGTPG
jgi:hypothetical protein